MEDPKLLKEAALKYHKGGKIGTEIKTPMQTEHDLSLAYSPGVAYPCKEIEADPKKAYDLTSKCNLVAVISNGTAVLGLGDIGAAASKPVMEGKCALFKKFGGVDAIDIEVNEKDPDKFISVVQAIAGTFGGINLEDIKAPECFYIEKTLKKTLDIPLMHDDQHGTAIIAGAGLLNAAKIVGKELKDIKMVVIGAGGAAIACAKIAKKLGVIDIVMFDSKGALTSDRKDITDENKLKFVVNRKISCYKDALKGADMVMGLSRANILSEDDISVMAENPIVFVMSNPDPEISPELVRKAHPDAIIATGRSDYPNQINNVLCFPYIFRGALSARATAINEAMKLAAANALAELAREEIPADIAKDLESRHGRKLVFGREYIIPSPFDPRLRERVSTAVAEAAHKSGVAQN